jgi:CDP-diacylglycerol--serine O-phosphatidyltransferase
MEGDVTDMFDAEPEEGSPASRLRNHRMRRGVYILPSLFTVGNLFCGYYAVLATLRGNITDMDNAARAIGIAILFDALDGRVARVTGTSSEFGKQFDSLADVISFGVAPAFLAFAWGVRGVLASDLPQARHVYQIGWLVSFVFVICCAWRLARFNIHGMAPGGSRFFVGMPTPAAAGMIAAMVHGVWWPIEDWRVAVLWQVLVLALAALMSSTVRYYSFKDINWHRRQPSLTVVALALLIAAFWVYSEITLLLVAGSYTVSGLVIQLVRVVRHRHTASHPA